MKVIFEYPEDVLRPQVILCSDNAMIAASLYKNDIVGVSSNIFLSFTAIFPNELEEEFYLIETKHHPNSSDFELIEGLREILKTIEKKLELQNLEIKLLANI